MRPITNIAGADFEIISPLALPEDEVHLWQVDLEAVRGNEARWQQILSTEEAARGSRFRSPHDRQNFVATRALLRIVLAGYLEADAKTLVFSYSKKEKPFLAAEHGNHGIQFNVSHSGSIALFAFTRGREIGVDVEKVRHDFDPEPIARRFFSAYEQTQFAALPPEEKFAAFFRCWTRKEAYIKATGDGLSLPLTQFDVALGSFEGNALLATRSDSAEAGRWLLQEIAVPPGYVAALCVRGHDWKLRAG